jgi:site-specific DNA recombinase
VSLQEQRAAIERYATKNGIQITRWFEERETAAKRGRAIFTKMMALLRDRKATGVLIHKIDRSARNLRDWSDLGEMIDSGIEIHFANESLDLASRGGRLSADIQAVVAADFIRNLSQEAKKGMRGRYKQGLLPLPAPIGYLDQGSGQPKSIDQAQGPIVRRMFELYVSGNYTIPELAAHMYELGLRTKKGQMATKSVVGRMLTNPYYYGIVRLKGTGEIFEGRHKPLISQTLFRAAREVASQRWNKAAIKHDFLYRRSIRCAMCGYCLSGECTKGIIYYRCHTKTCPTNTIREDVVTSELLREFAALAMPEEERQYLERLLNEVIRDAWQQREDVMLSLQASIGNVRARMSRLMDAYLDDVVNRETLQEKQKTLLLECNELEGQLRAIEERQDLLTEKLKDFMDFVADIQTVFKNGSPNIRQRMLRRIASRITVANKTITVVFERSYQLFASRPRTRSQTSCGVMPSVISIPNHDRAENTTVVIGQKQNASLHLVGYELNGSPPQPALRTLFVEIGKELITSDIETAQSEINGEH